MAVLGVLALAVVLGPAAAAPAQISLFQDFDGGSLDIANTTIDEVTSPLAPVLDLAPRHTWNEDPTKWWAMHFRADGFLDTTPQFTLPIHWGAYPKSDQRMVYSYDLVNWQYFDNGLNGGTKYSFSNSTPFTQDQVYVSSVIPYPVSKTEAYVNSIKSSPYVHPTASSDPNLVVGMTPGTVGGWYAYPTDPNDQVTWNHYTDDLGRTVEPQKLYGFKITDESATGPKAKIVITVGSHPSETLSHYAVEGLVNKLLSSDPQMAELREMAEFYIYPQLNPEGRYHGYYRTSPVRPSSTNPDENGGDHNRTWDDAPHTNPEVEILKAAMRNDTGAVGGGDLDRGVFAERVDDIDGAGPGDDAVHSGGDVRGFILGEYDHGDRSPQAVIPFRGPHSSPDGFPIARAFRQSRCSDKGGSRPHRVRGGLPLQ